MNKSRWSFLFCCAFFFLSALPQDAQARNLHGRLGIGYNAQLSGTDPSTGFPALSVKYALTEFVAFALIASVATTDPLFTATGLKFMNNVFFETNLNFYYFVTGALLATTGTLGAEFQGGLGAEFFIPGIESLGLSFEAGLAFENSTGTFVLRTLGLGIFRAGIHFYF